MIHHSLRCHLPVSAGNRCGMNVPLLAFAVIPRQAHKRLGPITESRFYQEVRDYYKASERFIGIIDPATRLS